MDHFCEIWGTPAHLQKDYVAPAYFPEERNRALLGAALHALARAIGWVGFEPSFVALVLGALAIGVYLSFHFGKVRRDKSGR